MAAYQMRHKKMRSWFSGSFNLSFFLITAATFFFVFLFLLSVHSAFSGLRSRTKTLVGHNLGPTPWHPFFPRSDKPTAFSLIQCLYLSSCPKLTPLLLGKSLNTYSANSLNQCPSFFASIRGDLAPWRQSGISLSLVESAARDHGAFRVVIKDNKLYVDLFYACVQSRMLFTVWGLLQLVRRYPGLVPDVDMVFDCMDRPVVNRTVYGEPGAPIPPPLFRYCTTKEHFDIPFPDWTFWGWPEVNIKPWNEEFESIKKGSDEIKWEDKVEFAYWKGNPDVQSSVRMELLSCNDSSKWQTQIFVQDWIHESTSGFKKSSLSSQCNHRYKIYAEGFAWSVSLKYILACGSETLIINPKYQDFFSRGLVSKENFWPISSTDLCPSLKTAVNWGNNNPSKAREIGQKGQELMEDIKMDRVYDYMFHLLMEYSKLQGFKPNPSPSAQEVCVNSLFCIADERQREFLEKSLESPSKIYPCFLSRRKK